MIEEKTISSNTVFIISDTYQLMQAIEWSASNNVQIKVFNTNPNLKLYNTDNIAAYQISRVDLYRTVDNVLNTYLNPEQQEFFRCMYDPDTELHVFDNVELLFQKGFTDVHLHEAGESSYTLSDRTGYYGEDDPHVVVEYHLLDQINDNQDKCKRMKHRPAFKKMGRKLKQEICKVLGIKILPTSGKKTILYIHNEPDEIRYNAVDIEQIHNDVRTLLKELKDAGYSIWFKDHHKRPGRLYIDDLVDKIIDCPIELLDTKKFYRIVSIRSRALDIIQGDCYNGVTLEAVTKCRKNFAHVYKRGIEKLRKNLINE